MRPRPFAAIEVGTSAVWSHEITAAEVDAFAQLSGDRNPLHMDDEFARRQGFSGRVVHGMLINAFLSRMLGMDLPGAGVLWLSQSTRFVQPTYIGSRIEVMTTVKHKSESTRSLVLETLVRDARGETVLTGESKVMVLGQVPAVPWTETVVLVTGASRGIGAASALAFGSRQSKVVVNYHSRRDRAEEVVAAIGAAGGRAIAVQGDVSTEAGAGAVAETTLERFGAIHVLVNNASPRIEGRPLTETGWGEMERYWRAYVQAAFLLGQKLVPAMKAQGYGRIVNILSSAVFGTPPVNLAAYITGKSALWGLSRAMAVELAPHGITVNMISPAAVLTEQWEGAPESRRRAMAMRTPMRELASPEDVANALLYLASDQGRSITGHNLLLTGGEVM
jgi:3-oxoacyl-[acyl-carrier protein] reductase